MADLFKVKVDGRAVIRDMYSGKILLDKTNAIHKSNFCVALARGLSHNSIGPTGLGTNQIYKMRFGNGGSKVDPLGNQIYLSPNITGSSSDLYNPIHEVIIDDASPGCPATNSVNFLSADAGTANIITCSVSLEPNMVASIFGATDFRFDEIGLFTSDGKMLSHLIFAPISKTAAQGKTLTYFITLDIE